MRPPRFRIRTLMILVALVALGLAAGVFYQRSKDFAARAWDHEANGSIVSDSELVRYHFAMAEKYHAAARRPWISVPPDPRPPK